MRILEMIEPAGRHGGIEKLMTETAVRMRARHGHDITILTLYETDPAYGEYLHDHGIGYECLHTTNKFNPLLYKRVSRLINTGHFDIAHAHHSTTQVLGALAKRYGHTQARFALTEHQTGGIRRKIPFLRKADRWVYDSYDHVTAVSATAQESLLQWLRRAPSPRYSVICNGVDRQTLLCGQPCRRGDFGLSDSDTVVASIGRLTAGKSQATLIDAIALLPSDFKAVIIGDGPEREALTQHAAEKGVSQRVVFTGKRSDVGALLRMADCYVSCSKEEGFGLTLVEAAFCQRPIAATDIAAHREILGDEGLFPLEDSKTLARLIQHGPMATPAPDDIFRRYDFDQMVDQYERLYQTLLQMR